MIEDLHKICLAIESIITKLENEDNSNLKLLNEKFDKFKEEIRGLSLHPTKPHTCPVCNGLGYWPVKLITKDDDLLKSLSFDENLWCRPCEGKGIVWG